MPDLADWPMLGPCTASSHRFASRALWSPKDRYQIQLEPATQQTAIGEVCGPVRIQIEGFRPIFGEVLFVEMAAADGNREPLLGYIPLEQSQAAVDLLGHRLVQTRRFDLK